MTKRKPTAIEKIAYLKDFVTDGCTMSPDLEFAECCNTHDLDYSTTDKTRTEADRDLRQCIDKKGYPYLSIVYWFGVRVFGWIPYYFGRGYAFRQFYTAAIKNQK
jgi:hypothetical protein